MNQRAAFLLAACTLAVAACGSDTTQHPQVADGGVEAMGHAACADDGRVDLAGTWAGIARFSLRLRSQSGGVVTVCPEGQPASAELLWFARVDAQGSSTLSLTAWPCSLSLPTVSAVVGECRAEAGNVLSTNILFPRPLVDAFPDIPVGTVNGTLQGTAWDAPLSVDRFGFTWGARDEGATLPRWTPDTAGCGVDAPAVGRTSQCETGCVTDCSALNDDDADGYPGVTLHVCGTLPDDVASNVPCRAESPNEPGVTLQGLLYMVLHTELALTGKARSSCEVAGTFASDTVYSVVGADAWLAGTRVSVASAISSLPLFDAVESESVFRMVRADGAYGTTAWGLALDDLSAACELVRARRNELQ
jgi:hypothetical protein